MARSTGIRRETGTGTRRETLNRNKVLQASIALADAEGVDGVSMRRLADQLKVVPMALYKHVADKEDLLDGMVDTVIAELGVSKPSADPSQTQGWAAEVTGLVLAARQAVTRHPWLRRAIETRSRRTPAVLGHMEAVTRLFLRGGLSPDLTHHAMHALGNRIWGFSPELFNEADGATGTERPRSAPAPNPEDYPSILAVAADAQTRRPLATGCDEDFEFAFALDLLLDGIARLHESGWTSGTKVRASIEDR